MENLNEIIVVLKKLSQDGKDLYLENIIDLGNIDKKFSKLIKTTTEEIKDLVALSYKFL